MLRTGDADAGFRVDPQREAAPLAFGACRSGPGEPVEVGHLSAEQEWAVDVAMAARLEVHQRGYLALRHMRPPAPYLPSGYHL